MIKFEQVLSNHAIRTYINESDNALRQLGFTDHGPEHTTKVANGAAYILKTLGYPEKDIELAKIAGYMHDIGNLVNRTGHSQSGAVMAFRLLSEMEMPAEDIAVVTSAIGNHDEGTGVPVNAVAAALILADKSDVRRCRVRNCDKSSFDIHDRVNYSVEEAVITINNDKSNITLKLAVDKSYGSVMDYFEIFLKRMIMCRHAAKYLGMDFKLVINGQCLI